MMNNSIKSIIDKRLAALTVSEELQSKILSAASPKRKCFRKTFAVVAAAVLFLMLSVTAMAALTPGGSFLLSQISPGIARFLNPVEASKTDNGLKIEVVGAMRDENSIIVYMTIQDLTGDRIDTFTGISDCDIHGGFLRSQQTVAYDEQTKTATLRLVVDDFGGPGDGKLTIQINTLDNWMKSNRTIDSGVDLSSVSSVKNTLPLNFLQMSYGGYEFGSELRILQERIVETYNETGIVDVLIPDEMNIPIRFVDSAYISNIGTVDGDLHIQIRNQFTKPEDYISNLVDGTGERYIGSLFLSIAPVDEYPSSYGFLYTEYESMSGISFNFAVDEIGNPIPYFVMEDTDEKFSFTTHTEYIFSKVMMDIELTEELSAYRLFARVGGGAIIEGNWRTSFKIEPENIITSQCSINTDNIHIDSFAISPFQLYFFGRRDFVPGNAVFDVQIIMKDGTTRKYGATICHDDETRVVFQIHTPIVTSEGIELYQDYFRLSDGTLDAKDDDEKIEMRLMPELPLDIENISQISLNGNVISFG